jgi:hypothetical protein
MYVMFYTLLSLVFAVISAWGFIFDSPQTENLLWLCLSFLAGIQASLNERASV